MMISLSFPFVGQMLTKILHKKSIANAEKIIKNSRKYSFKFLLMAIGIRV